MAGLLNATSEGTVRSAAANVPEALSSPLGIGIISIAVIATISSILSGAGQKSQIPQMTTPWYLPGSIATMLGGRDLIIQAARKYPGQLVRIPMFPFGHMYIANGTKYVEEIRTAPNDVLDFWQLGTLMTQFDHTVGKRDRDPFYFHMVKTTLTRNLNALFSDLMDEVECSFEEILALSGNEWKVFPAQATMVEITARVSNRIFVGKPLCRNTQYITLAKDILIHAWSAAFVINCFPSFLRQFVGRLLGKGKQYRQKMAKVLKGEVEERRLGYAQYGLDWAQKSNDFMNWIIEHDMSNSKSRTMDQMALIFLHLNFAALHTSAGTFTHMLLTLATEPSYQDLLREEISSHLAEEGNVWSKELLQKMKKVDSFLRESMRVHSIVGTSLHRKAAQDFTFSDGIVIPKGSWVCSSVYAAQMDPNVYENPEFFNPWRFSDQREIAPADTSLVSTATGSSFLSFGYGNHACAGRFFAANEVKAMLAYLVLNFDVKLEHPGERPKNLCIGVNCVPNPKARILIRRRTQTTCYLSALTTV